MISAVGSREGRVATAGPLRRVGADDAVGEAALAPLATWF